MFKGHDVVGYYVPGHPKKTKAIYAIEKLSLVYGVPVLVFTDLKQAQEAMDDMKTGALVRAGFIRLGETPEILKT